MKHGVFTSGAGIMFLACPVFYPSRFPSRDQYIFFRVVRRPTAWIYYEQIK